MKMQPITPASAIAFALALVSIAPAITTPVSQGAKATLQNTDAVGIFAAVSDPVQAHLVPPMLRGHGSASLVREKVRA